MNLHNITGGAIGAVNPCRNAILRVFNTYDTDENGYSIPSYLPDQIVSCQIQPLSQDDIEYVQGLNLQGNYKSVYCNGDFKSINRADDTGGDLFIYLNKTWKIVKVREVWDGWCHFYITEQIDG